MTSGIGSDAGSGDSTTGDGLGDSVLGSDERGVPSESATRLGKHSKQTQSRKYRGYESQRIAADYLRHNGFPHAEPVGAGRSGTDVTGLLGIDLEVKARAGLDLPALMRQLRERDVENVLGVGLLRLNGQGPATIADWPAVIRFADLVTLLRGSGYGDPL